MKLDKRAFLTYLYLLITAFVLAMGLLFGNALFVTVSILPLAGFTYLVLTLEAFRTSIILFTQKRE